MSKVREAIRAVVEPLEQRIYLSLSPAISGNTSVNAGADYTLGLSVTGGTPNYWSVDWGDGSATSPDIQTVYGNPSSVTHQFPVRAGNYSITASATDSTGPYLASGGSPLNVSVLGGAPLQITGPDTGSVNVSIDLQAQGGNVSGGSNPLAYVWNVTEGGQAVATGSGPQLDFVPQSLGSFLATVTAIGDPAGPSVATHVMSVVGSDANIKVAGPGILVVGHNAAFNFSEQTVLDAFGTDLQHQWDSDVQQSGGTAGPNFQWTVTDSGNNTVKSASGYFFNGDQTFPVPQTLLFSAPSAGTYTISFKVVYNGTTYFQNTQSLLAVPAATHDFTTTVLPLPVGAVQSALVDSAVQADGKILVLSISDSNDQYTITRLNPDLTVDNTFGTTGTGVVSGSLPDDLGFLSGSEFSQQGRIAIDEAGRIVVAFSCFDFDAGPSDPKQRSNSFQGGSYPADISYDVWLVARFNSDGTTDSNFGGSGTGTVREESGYLGELDALTIAGNGQIYLGGTGYTAAQQGPLWTDDPDYSGFETGPLYRPCFAIMRLDDGGGLDASFGNTNLDGITTGGSYGLDFVPVDSDSHFQYGQLATPPYQVTPYLANTLMWGMEIARSILVEPDGEIIVGGITTQYHNAASLEGGSVQVGSQPTTAGFALVKIQSNGSLDTTFGAGTGKVITYFNNTPLGLFNDAWLRSLSQDGNGDIVAMGSAGPWWDATTSLHETTDPTYFAAARYLPDGTLDPSFGTNSSHLVVESLFGNDAPYTGTLTAGGDIVIAGQTSDGGVIAALNSDGSPDTSFFAADSPAGDRIGYNVPATYNNIFGNVLSLPNGNILLVGAGQNGANTAENETVVAEYRPTELKVGNLVATASPAGPINLTWQNLGAGQDGFEILRSNSEVSGSVLGSPTTVVAEVGPDQTTYSDASVSANTTYYYQVIAFGTNSASGALVPGGSSNVASATTAPTDTSFVLADIVPIDIQGNVATSSISLKEGQYYEFVASGYFDLGGPGDLYRADAEYGWYTSGTPHDIEPGVGGVNYGIAVSQGTPPAEGALKFPYWGPVSTTADHSYTIGFTATQDGPVSFRYFDDYYPDNKALTYPMQVEIYRALPSSPGNLVATAVHTPKQINLSWTDTGSVGTAGSSIIVQRQLLGSSDWQTLATLPAGSTSYSDNSADYNQPYQYQVFIQNSFGQSGPSNVASAVIRNLPPAIQFIPLQVAYVGTEYLFQVQASDPQDGTTGLTYSISGGPSSMAIDPTSGQISGWTPTEAEFESPVPGYNVTVTVTDAENSSASTTLAVEIAPPTASIPHTDNGGVAAHVVSQTDKTITLAVSGVDSTSTNGSDISYTWAAASQPAQAGAPVFSVNGSNGASQTVATVSEAGTYVFKVVMDNGNGWPGESDVTVTVGQVLNSIIVTPTLSAVVAGPSSQAQLTAHAFDQFGFLMTAQPTFNWSLDSGSTAHGNVSSTSAMTATYTAPTSVGGTSSDTIDATVTGDSAIGVASVTVTANSNTAPVIVNDDANPISFTQLQLTATATDPLYPGTDSHLIYTWQLTPLAPNTAQATLSDNGTNSAKAAIATVPANTPFDYQITLTVTNNIGQSTSDTFSISDTRNFTRIALTPVENVINPGQTVTFSAVAQDQYFKPLTSQPTFVWQVDGVTVTGVTGSSYSYTPTSTGDHNVTVSATVGSTTEIGTADVSVVPVGPPVMQIASPGTSSGGTPPTISSATPVDIVADNPDGVPVSWSLWLVPENSSSGAEIASSSQSVGQPGTPAQAAVLDPASYANGIYSLELRDGSNTVVDTKVLSINSTIKLGNLTLPFTDLTVNQPGSQPITATRTYDSSQAAAGVNSSNLGFGWQLNLNNKLLKTTATLGTNDGDSTPAFTDGDLVYITLPNGQQYTFEFVAQNTGQAIGNPLSGLLAQVETYTPAFLSVDGSGAKLLPYAAGSPTSVDLVQNQGTSGAYYYVNADTSNGVRNYNPTDASTFGGIYTLITSDGFQYQINASTGTLNSAKDPNGNAINYNLISTTQGASGHIVSLSGGGQTVRYAYDSNGNLIGVIDPVGNKTTYQYGDQLVVQYDGSSSSTVSAVITNGSQIWNPSAGTWTTGTPGSGFAINLTPVTDAAMGYQYLWYFAAEPISPPSGNVTITYYANGNYASTAAIGSESRTFASDGPHEMTAIIDPRGVKTLTASYVSGGGELSSLTQTDEKSDPVSTGQLTAGAVNSQSSGFVTGSAITGTDSQAVTDSAGNKTENVYDAEGDVMRQIKTLTDANGNLTGYQITVTNYSYVTADAFNPQDGGMSMVNAPISVVQYAPFEIVGQDSGGLRYSESPTTPVLQSTSYDIGNGEAAYDASDPSLRLPTSQESLVGTAANGDYTYQVTNYGYSAATSTSNPNGKPTSVTESLEFVKPDGTIDSQYPQQLVSKTISTYDLNGNAVYSLQWTGQNDSTTGYGIYQGTQTVYESVGGVNGLVYQTYKVVAEVASNGAVQTPTQSTLITQNTYYSGTNNATGAFTGMLQSSETFDGSGSNQTTNYAYDPQGNQILSYTTKSWSTSTGSPINGWTVNITQYNQAGQQTDTYQGAYVGTGTLAYSINAGSGTTGVVTVNTAVNPIYVDSTQTSSTSGSPLHTSHTDYNADGQAADTLDQYQTATINVYDINGNAIDTIYPDHTEVRTVYDSLGRVILQTDRYKTNTVVNTSTNQVTSYDSTTTAPATVTLYNSLGQAYRTERYQNVIITISPDSNAPVNSGIEMAIAPTGLTPQSANFISYTQTWFDDQGRTIETRDAAGLRTGTIYYPGGQVEYTGPLNAGAPDGGELNSSTGVISFQLSDFASYTQYLYNQLTTTTTSSGFTIPAVNSTVSVSVNSTTGFSVGQYVTVAGAGGFTIASITNGTTLVLANLGTDLSGNANATGNVAAGATVSTGLYNRVTDPNGHHTDAFQAPGGLVSFTAYDDGSFTETIKSIGDQPISGYAVTPVGSTTASLPTIPTGGSETVSIAQRKSGDPAVATIEIDDAAGNLVDEWEPPVPNPSNRSQNVNPQWQYTYDASGNEISQTDPNGGTTAFAYDENGDKVSQSLPDGEVQTWSYDAFGNNILHQVFSSSADNSQYPIETTQDTYDTSSDGHGGELQAESRYEGQDYALGLVDENTGYTYDSLGRVASVTDTYFTTTEPGGGGGPANLPTIITLPASESPTGSAITLTWSDQITPGGVDDGGGYVSDTSYDWYNPGSTTQTEVALLAPYALNQIDGWGPYGNGSASSGDWGLVAYNSANGGSSFDADYSLSGSVFHYDSTSPGNGASGQFASFTPAQSIDPAQTGSRQANPGRYAFISSTTYAYDPVTGKESAITTSLSSLGVQGYSAGQQPVGGGRTNYIYDSSTGNLLETWTGSTHANATTDVKYGYDAQGRLTSVTQVKLDGQSPTTGTNFDANGNILAANSATTYYSYDAAGNLLYESDPNGMTTVYSYDSLNQLHTETVTTGGTTPLFSQTYTYWDNGLKKTDNETHTYSTGSSQTLDYSWAYDGIGRLASETLATSGSNAPAGYTDAFTYDLDNNRIKESVTGGTTGNGTINYTYNPGDQLVKEVGTFTNSGNNYQKVYAYDAGGNLVTEDGSDQGGGNKDDLFSYDLRNRMIGQTSFPDGTATVTEYAYDPNGVLTAQTTYIPDTANDDLAYPAQSTVAAYLNDPNNPTGYAKAIESTTLNIGQNETNVYTATRGVLLGLGVIAQRDSATGMAYLLTDGHNSTRALTGTTGTVITGQIYDYDTFGDALNFTPSAAQTVWLFGGDGWFDSANGLTNHLARWRNGFWFTQSDPTEIAAGDLANANLYVYVGGNPLNGWDPNGHLDLIQTLAFIGISAIVAGIGLQYIGGVTHNATLQTIGSWTTTGGTFVAGASLAVAFGPASVPVWLRIAAGSVPGVVRLLWNQTIGKAANSAQTAAKQLSISNGLFYVLSDANVAVPLAGRIIQRPGQANWWELGYVNIAGQAFMNQNVPLQQGDLIYDYAIVDKLSGQAIVHVRRFTNAATGQFEDDGTFAIQNGQLAGLPYMNAPTSSSASLPNMQVIGY